MKLHTLSFKVRAKVITKAFQQLISWTNSCLLFSSLQPDTSEEQMSPINQHCSCCQHCGRDSHVISFKCRGKKEPHSQILTLVLAKMNLLHHFYRLLNECAGFIKEKEKYRLCLTI